MKTRGPDARGLIFIYAALASGCIILGVLITFGVLIVCAYLDYDISRHLWVLTIPAGLSLLLNVIFIELYRKFRYR